MFLDWGKCIGDPYKIRRCSKECGTPYQNLCVGKYDWKIIRIYSKMRRYHPEKNN
jgi:hypothetical protein